LTITATLTGGKTAGLATLRGRPRERGFIKINCAARPGGKTAGLLTPTGKPRERGWTKSFRNSSRR